MISLTLFHSTILGTTKYEWTCTHVFTSTYGFQHSVRESLTEMKLSKKCEEGKEAVYAHKQGEVHTRQGHSQCQGRKTGICLVYPGKKETASVAAAE